MITCSQFLLLSLLGICFASLAFGATTLPEEVRALEVIGRTLGKKDWDFNQDPCSGHPSWVTPNPEKGAENNVSCNCTVPNDRFCHVVSMRLR